MSSELEVLNKVANNLDKKAKDLESQGGLIAITIAGTLMVVSTEIRKTIIEVRNEQGK